jgi:hypothetical protein
VSRIRWMSVAFALAAAFASDGQAPLAGLPPDTAQLARDAEQLLAAGDARGAEAVLDRAAGATHAAEIEVALVRTYMQAGEYRRALGFAAHAAGAHREFPQASGLYAWLLHIGGQQQIAARLLDTAHEAAPDAPLLEGVRERLAQPWPLADGAMLAPPARLAPYASADPAPAAVLGSALLVGGGRQALLPAVLLDRVLGDATLWLRNGLGTTVRGKLARRIAVGGVSLALLELEQMLPIPSDLAAAARAPFAGAVGYLIEFAATDQHATPAWPQLRLGFFGRAGGAAELPLLGIEVPTGARGGVVLDEAGRIAGIAVRSSDGRDRLAPVALLQAETGALFGPVSLDRPTPRLPVDFVYERSLLLALQVIAASSSSPTR